MRLPVEDASGFRGEADRIIAPAEAGEVANLLREASRLGVAVTASGAGTGITGGRCPAGGWLLSLDQLTRLEVGRGAARVGAGVLLKDLQAAAARSGQFYAPDPTEWTASLGGNIATNASGARSFRYGSTRRHLRSLTAAFMDGGVRTFQRAEMLDFAYTPVRLPATSKNTAGYYLPEGAGWVDLLCGSEGTLAVVVEAEVELLPRPEAVLSGVVFFPHGEAALDAVDSWRGIPQLVMLEYLDRPSLEMLRPAYGAAIPTRARACLIIEQELDRLAGDPLEDWLARMAGRSALDESWFGETAADRERFRAFRHALPEAVNARVRRNGFQKLSSDFAVPAGRNREMMAYYSRTLEDVFARKFTVYGHIGDSHVHVNILSESEADFERGQAWMTDAAREAVRLGGTVSAEHGLGKRKRHLLPLMYTGAEIDSMRSVKRRLDPGWLLGRQNIFSDPVVTD